MIVSPRHPTRPAVFVWVALLALAPGCADEARPPADPDREQTDILRDTHALVKTYTDAKQRPPARPIDMIDGGNAFPSAMDAVAKGEIVVVWGGMPRESAAGVLAYIKGVPDAGGLVLLQNGEVKRLTAAEFATAPKAGR